MKMNSFPPVLRKSATALAALFAVAIAGTVASKTAVAEKGETDGKQSTEPEFVYNFDEATAEAEKSNRPIIVIASASWCPPCQQMKKEVYPSETIRPYHKNFVWAYLDADDPENGPILQALGVQGLPHLAFFTPDVKLMGNFTGGVSADQFSGVLDQVLEFQSQASEDAPVEVE